MRRNEGTHKSYRRLAREATAGSDRSVSIENVRVSKQLAGPTTVRAGAAGPPGSPVPCTPRSPVEMWDG